MKYITMLFSSISVLFVVVLNLYYNSITLDVLQLENYVLEFNIILNDFAKNSENLYKEKEKYIDRLEKIQSGIKSTKTSFLVDNYKNYKIKSIDNLKNVLDNKNLDYLNYVYKYNKLSENELSKLVN